MEAMTTIFAFGVAALVAVLISRDATSRGMNGLGWGIFTFLLCIVAVPIYLIVRKPVQDSTEQRYLLTDAKYRYQVDFDCSNTWICVS